MANETENNLETGGEDFEAKSPEEVAADLAPDNEPEVQDAYFALTHGYDHLTNMSLGKGGRSLESLRAEHGTDNVIVDKPLVDGEIRDDMGMKGVYIKKPSKGETKSQ